MSSLLSSHIWKSPFHTTNLRDLLQISAFSLLIFWLIGSQTMCCATSCKYGSKSDKITFHISSHIASTRKFNNFSTKGLVFGWDLFQADGHSNLVFVHAKCAFVSMPYPRKKIGRNIWSSASVKFIKVILSQKIEIMSQKSMNILMSKFGTQCLQTYLHHKRLGRLQINSELAQPKYRAMVSSWHTVHFSLSVVMVILADRSAWILLSNFFLSFWAQRHQRLP